MSTISFSVEDDVKRDVDKWAKKAGKSKSDILREMVEARRRELAWEKISRKTEKVLKELNIQTEEELYDYLESDETYESRLRQQRLSGRDQAK